MMRVTINGSRVRVDVDTVSRIGKQRWLECELEEGKKKEGSKTWKEG